MSLFLRNLYWRSYLLLTFGIWRYKKMNEQQLAQVATLATAVATAAQKQGQDDTVVDGINVQITALNTQLAAAQAVVANDQTATTAAINALTAYCANPT